MSDSTERIRAEFEEFVAPENRHDWLWNLWQQAFLLGGRAATEAALESAAQYFENEAARWPENSPRLAPASFLRVFVVKYLRALKPSADK